MRMASAVVLVGILGGCTSVKMVQRDGCWVRRTERRILGTVSEEVGPCARPTTAYVENDPLTRMVQECIARADYRWQMRALAAWDRREPWPEQLNETNVLQQCMDDSARGVLGEAATLKERNAALEKRLDELVKERQAERQRSEADRNELLARAEEQRRELFTRTDEERKELLAMQSKLGDHLGEAASKVQPLPAPAPAIATATATSEGRSSSDQTPGAQGQPATVAVVTGSPAAPAACPAPPPAAPHENAATASGGRRARAIPKAHAGRNQGASVLAPPGCEAAGPQAAKPGDPEARVVEATPGGAAGEARSARDR